MIPLESLDSSIGNNSYVSLTETKNKLEELNRELVGISNRFEQYELTVLKYSGILSTILDHCVRTKSKKNAGNQAKSLPKHQQKGVNQSVGILKDQAKKLEEERDYANSIYVLRIAIKFEEKYRRDFQMLGELYYCIARCLYMDGRYAEAIDNADIAISFTPHNEPSYLNIRFLAEEESGAIPQSKLFEQAQRNFSSRSENDEHQENLDLPQANNDNLCVPPSSSRSQNDEHQENLGRPHVSGTFRGRIARTGYSSSSSRYSNLNRNGTHQENLDRPRPNIGMSSVDPPRSKTDQELENAMKKYYDPLRR